MICKELIHIGIGDTGEGVVRNAIFNHLVKTKRIHNIDGGAHIPLSMARAFSNAPAFTFVRNPFDWYISHWMHELKMHRCQSRFDVWFYQLLAKGGMFKHWGYYTVADNPIGFVGRFEYLEEDLADILVAIIPDIVTTDEVWSWFPEAYRQWCLRPWIEGVEQWMRDAKLEEIEEGTSDIMRLIISRKLP